LAFQYCQFGDCRRRGQAFAADQEQFAQHRPVGKLLRIAGQRHNAHLVSAERQRIQRLRRAQAGAEQTQLQVQLRAHRLGHRGPALGHDRVVRCQRVLRLPNSRPFRIGEPAKGERKQQD